MRLTDFFTNAHMMCFDRRKTVWPSVEANLATLGIHPHRFISGDGSDSTLSYDLVDIHTGDLPERQRKNYLLAAQALVRREKERGADHILVLEDDVATYEDSAALGPGSVKLLKMVVEQAQTIPDFDVFYLHAVRLNSRSSHFSPNILRLNHALGFRALILRPRAMDIVLGLTPRGDRGVDGQFEQAVERDGLTVFSAWPCLLRADADRWSYQHNFEVKPLWLEMAMKEKGNCS